MCRGPENLVSMGMNMMNMKMFGNSGKGPESDRLLPVVASLLFALLTACSEEPQVSVTTLVATEPDAAQEAEPVLARSVAVLPFADLSEFGDQEYFSTGLTDDLINRLAMMPELQVAGRESSFQYQDRNVVLSEIGTSLQVANILLGSVRKSGDQLRVTAQLVNAANGFNYWSRSWDRELADVFVIQQEITDAVTTALSVTLGAGEFALPGMTRNIEAWDLSLQAQAMYNQFTPDAVFRALHLMEQALLVDPQFGRAWLLLGSMYNESPLILSADQAVDFPQLAVEAFRKARELTPELPELLLVDAGVERNAGRFVAAERLYLRYFEQYGYSSARAMEEYAQLLGRTGQMQAAVAMLQRAKRLEPLVPRYSYQVAMYQMIRGDAEAVQQEAAYGLTLDGGSWLFSALAWELALQQGDLALAARLIRDYYVDEPAYSDATVSRHFMEQVAEVLELNDFAASFERLAAMINSPGITPLELGYLARVVAVSGQPDAALDYWFGAASSPAIWDSIYADMRRLPDFPELLQQLGLLDYWRATGNWGDYCRPSTNNEPECY
jgi:TolB-like protein